MASSDPSRPSGQSPVAPLTPPMSLHQPNAPTSILLVMLNFDTLIMPGTIVDLLSMLHGRSSMKISRPGRFVRGSHSSRAVYISPRGIARETRKWWDTDIHLRNVVGLYALSFSLMINSHFLCKPQQHKRLPNPLLDQVGPAVGVDLEIEGCFSKLEAPPLTDQRESRRPTEQGFPLLSEHAVGAPPAPMYGNASPPPVTAEYKASRER